MCDVLTGVVEGCTMMTSGVSQMALAKGTTSTCHWCSKSPHFPHPAPTSTTPSRSLAGCAAGCSSYRQRPHIPARGPGASPLQTCCGTKAPDLPPLRLRPLRGGRVACKVDGVACKVGGVACKVGGVACKVSRQASLLNQRQRPQYCNLPPHSSDLEC